MLLVLALLITAPSAGTTFDVQATLQGLYDEISQTLLQVTSDSDVDQLHDVLYTPDCVFVDASGTQHTWAEMREEMLRVSKTEHVAEMIQRIEKISMTPQGATVLVQTNTVHPAAASPGAHDAPMITDTTTYRDTWVQMAGEWRLQSRTQVGALSSR